MSLTQKYKQQQQQVRVHTNESNYLKGMYYSDVPLAEGYSRVLLNYDTDSLAGKLTPRKGLQGLGVIRPEDATALNNDKGFNIIAASKVCSTSDIVDKRKINRHLQSILYNTETQALFTATCSPEITEDNRFKLTPFSVNTAAEYIAPEPYVIAAPGIHDKKCVHNNFFKKPVGTFAFGSSYYTFLKHSVYSAKLITELPNSDYKTVEGNVIRNFADLQNSLYATGVPGGYYLFTEASDNAAGILVYYNEDGILTVWTKSKDELDKMMFTDKETPYVLCYTKIGADLQDDDILLNAEKEILPDKYYVCVAQPKQLNPSEATSWGYNMLLNDPYAFVCEETAVNLVTILGILPYDKDNNIVLTPRKNQEITLKCFYRAPKAYHSDLQNAKFYATTKQRITDKDGNKQDPKTLNDLAGIDPNAFNFGDWWYCTDEKKYYMIMPAGSLSVKKLDLFGATQPAASEKLNVLKEGVENEIHLKWEMRSAGAATWTALYDDKFTLSEYAQRHGALTPFTITATLPDEEVMVRLTITDPEDVEIEEEYVLSTQTIGLSLVSDELANTLNLSPKNFSLGQCTGMCEWEQRLVIWGVPDALDTLFISDVNNPTFFPYPNNVDVFTDPIVAVHNYGNELLVLTTSALYRLMWDADGLTWTHKLVQQNLHITEEDAYMSCVIKNMFFFKSGEYYYMMVPKVVATSAVRGEVAIAPISKPIEELLDHFHDEIFGLMKVIIDQPDIENFTDKLVNYFSYVDSTKVVVNYVYALDATTTDTRTQDNMNSRYLYVQLIYDSDVRTWSMKVFEAAHMLYASHADAVQQDRFIDITPALNADKVVLQYYKFKDLSDVSTQYVNEEGVEVPVQRIVKNYQYLDTGNREINTELKKRFREFQFKIKNRTATNLGFFTSFLIDGSLRKDLQHYSPRFILDEKTGEGTIIVERVLDVNTMTYKNTRIERVIVPTRMLQDDGELTPTTLAEEQDLDRWVLNQSAFPGRTLWKIRMPISGKGYTPRAILLSTNEMDYELLGHAWVYRTMNGR